VHGSTKNTCHLPPRPQRPFTEYNVSVAFYLFMSRFYAYQLTETCCASSPIGLLQTRT
jgi:hypothetical protein